MEAIRLSAAAQDQPEARETEEHDPGGFGGLAETDFPETDAIATVVIRECHLNGPDAVNLQGASAAKEDLLGIGSVCERSQPGDGGSELRRGQCIAIERQRKLGRVVLCQVVVPKDD